MASRNFQDVEVWKKAHRLVLAIYRHTESYPRKETFGLTSQLRRAAYSVPANFAEGFARTSRNEKARFYNIAQASLEECRYFLILANDLGYGQTAELSEQACEVSRMLDAYTRATLTPSC
jgi:four helix bundle protein